MGSRLWQGTCRYGVGTERHPWPCAVHPKAQRAGVAFRDKGFIPLIPPRSISFAQPHRKHLMPTWCTHHNVTFIESRSLRFLHVENTFKKAGVCKQSGER